jgi:hypothetical protein
MTITPELFDTLIIACILIGLALAVVRLYADFTRPLPPKRNVYEDPVEPENESQEVR